MNLKSQAKTDEIALIRSMGNAAKVYMLLQSLEEPSGARGIAGMLGINEHTAARHLRRLEELKLVRRCGYRQGYELCGVPQQYIRDFAQLKARGRAVKNVQVPELAGEDEEPGTTTSLAQAEAEDAQNRQLLQDDKAESAQNDQQARQVSENDAPNVRQRARRKKYAAKSSQTSTTDSMININNNLRDSVVVGDGSKDSQMEDSIDRKNGEAKEHPGVWRELYACGIGRNARTQALVLQPYMTAEYVKAHRLKLEASGKRGTKWAGLLVTILESGEPAPAINPNGHLGDCECMECHAYRLARSWEDL